MGVLSVILLLIHHIRNKQGSSINWKRRPAPQPATAYFEYAVPQRPCRFGTLCAEPDVT